MCLDNSEEGRTSASFSCVRQTGPGGRPCVLVVNYACSPSQSSEHLYGWEWARELSRDFEVILVARPWQDGLEEACRRHGIKLYKVSVPRWTFFTQSLFRRLNIWLRLYMWLPGARREIGRILKKHKVDLIVQNTFHSVWMPLYAGRTSIPVIKGPIGGAERIPPGFSRYLGRGALWEKIRALIMRMGRFLPPVRRAARRPDILFLSNESNRSFFPPEKQKSIRIVPANSMEDSLRIQREGEQEARKGDGEIYPRTWDGRSPLRLLYMGICEPRRGLPLLWEALSEASASVSSPSVSSHVSPHSLRHSSPRSLAHSLASTSFSSSISPSEDEKSMPDWHLDIAGGGFFAEEWTRMVKRAGLEKRITCHGFKGGAARDELFRQAHFLVFPSLRDSGGTALLEAVERGLPVLTFDLGGPGEIARHCPGCIALPVTHPDETKQAIARFFRTLTPESYAEKVAGTAHMNYAPYTWEAKRRAVRQAYEDLIRHD